VVRLTVFDQLARYVDGELPARSASSFKEETDRYKEVIIREVAHIELEDADYEVILAANDADNRAVTDCP
jgi:hypothetical protein